MLEIIDYQILEYISKFDKVYQSEILANFKNVKSIEARLDELSTSTLKSMPYGILIPYNDNLIKKVVSENIYFKLTSLGTKVLEDWISTQEVERKKLWTENVKMPFIVALLTYLLLDGIKWLLPRLPELFASLFL